MASREEAKGDGGDHPGGEDKAGPGPQDKVTESQEPGEVS